MFLFHFFQPGLTDPSAIVDNVRRGPPSGSCTLTLPGADLHEVIEGVAAVAESGGGTCLLGLDAKGRPVGLRGFGEQLRALVAAVGPGGLLGLSVSPDDADPWIALRVAPRGTIPPMPAGPPDPKERRKRMPARDREMSVLDALAALKDATTSQVAEVTRIPAATVRFVLLDLSRRDLVVRSDPRSRSPRQRYRISAAGEARLKEGKGGG